MDGWCREIEGESEGSVELKELLRREIADIVGEHGFGKTDELVAVDAAVVFQPLLDSDWNLAVEAIAPGVDRSAHDAREPRAQKQLPAHNDENPGFARIES